MSSATKPLEELIHDLPPRLRMEVRTFIEFLLNKHKHPTKRKLRQDWAGELKFSLDFDDAYQYVAAEREQAIIINFDKDFDKTLQGRQTPAQVVKLRS